MEKLTRNEKEYDKWYSNLNNIASINEMTGLIPSQPLPHTDLEAYSDIISIPQQGEEE